MATEKIIRFPMRQLIPAFAVALRGDPNTPPAGLTWRVKQLQRQDWPATLAQDGRIKQGYTPRQVLRLIAALSLVDAGLGPTDAVQVASDYENTILAIMAGTIGPRPAQHGQDQLVAMIRPRSLDGVTVGLGGAVDLALTAITASTIGKALTEDAACNAWLFIDVAGQAARAFRLLAVDEMVAKEFRAVVISGASETLAGRGRIDASHPVGDRYRTRKAGVDA